MVLTGKLSLFPRSCRCPSQHVLNSDPHACTCAQATVWNSATGDFDVASTLGTRTWPTTSRSSQLLTTLHNCRRTKGLADPSEEIAQSLSSQGELGKTQCYIPKEVSLLLSPQNILAWIQGHIKIILWSYPPLSRLSCWLSKFKLRTKWQNGKDRQTPL